MPVVKRTAQAEENLITLWLHLAMDNPFAADRLLDDLDRTVCLLAEQSLLGPARSDIAPELRYFPQGSYVIL